MFRGPRMPRRSDFKDETDEESPDPVPKGLGRTFFSRRRRPERGQNDDDWRRDVFYGYYKDDDSPKCETYFNRSWSEFRPYGCTDRSIARLWPNNFKRRIRNFWLFAIPAIILSIAMTVFTLNHGYINKTTLSKLKGLATWDTLRAATVSLRAFLLTVSNKLTTFLAACCNYIVDDDDDDEQRGFLAAIADTSNNVELPTTRPVDDNSHDDESKDSSSVTTTDDDDGVQEPPISSSHIDDDHSPSSTTKNPMSEEGRVDV